MGLRESAKQGQEAGEQGAGSRGETWKLLNCNGFIICFCRNFLGGCYTFSEINRESEPGKKEFILYFAGVKTLNLVIESHTNLVYITIFKLSGFVLKIARYNHNFEH